MESEKSDEKNRSRPEELGLLDDELNVPDLVVYLLESLAYLLSIYFLFLVLVDGDEFLVEDLLRIEVLLDPVLVKEVPIVFVEGVHVLNDLIQVHELIEEEREDLGFLYGFVLENAHHFLRVEVVDLASEVFERDRDTE